MSKDVVEYLDSSDGGADGPVVAGLVMRARGRDRPGSM